MDIGYTKGSTKIIRDNPSALGMLKRTVKGESGNPEAYHCQPID